MKATEHGTSRKASQTKKTSYRFDTFVQGNDKNGPSRDMGTIVKAHASMEKTDDNGSENLPTGRAFRLLIHH